MNTATFLFDQYKLFKAGYQVKPDASLLHVKFKKDYFNNIMVNDENEKKMSCVKFLTDATIAEIISLQGAFTSRYDECQERSGTRCH